MQQGIFTISLDFELFWGVRDHRTIEKYGENIKNVHMVVPQLLELFKKYNIHCTWATVGFLFFNSKQQLLAHLPNAMPNYENTALQQYKYINGTSQLDEVYHFAPSLIEQIKNTNGQEIGTHTYSHYYCLEKGADTISFNEDLLLANKVASNFGIANKSIVFPRNQYSDDMLNICKQNGINIYRGTEEHWIYKTRSRASETIFRRLCRLLDVYVNITGFHIHKPINENGCVNIPSSRFLRPYSKKLAILDGLKLQRIKRAMTAAAKQHKIYHLWWHPHNFGSNMSQNFSMLEKILQHYNLLQEKYNFTSLNMLEIVNKTT